MPHPSARTPAKSAKMIAMHRDGASAREIADALGVDHRTVRTWLRDAGLEPNGGAGKRTSRKRPEPDAATSALADTASDLAEFGSGPPPRDRAGALAHLGRRLSQISTLADMLGEQAKSGDANPQQLATAVKLESELASRIVELTPADVPDPDKDPTNLDAAATVRRRFEKLVVACEERERDTGKCRACGQVLPLKPQEPAR